MIFADGGEVAKVIQDNGSWIALTLSLIGNVVIPSLFTYLNNRIKTKFDIAKLEFDAEMVTLKQRVTDCEDHPELGRIALADKIKVLENKLDTKIQACIQGKCSTKPITPLPDLGPLN